MKDSGIKATDELGKVISKWPDVEHDRIIAFIEARTGYFRDMYKEGGAIEFVKAFYEAFDEVIAQSKGGTKTSCKKGCHFCCRQNITIWKDEAAAIAEYCKEHGIDIPKTYLLEQLKHGWKEVAKTDVGWCTFLRDGECGIYPVRPLACRKYFVVSPPEECDTVKFPSDKGFRVQVAVFTMPEVEVSAYCGVMADNGKAGRMPELLLPYSK